MGVDARGFPGGLLRLNPAFAYVKPPSSGPLSRAEYLTLAPNTHHFILLFLDAAIIFSLLYSFFPYIFFFFNCYLQSGHPSHYQSRVMLSMPLNHCSFSNSYFKKLSKLKKKKKKTANKTKKQWSYNSYQDLSQSLTISFFYLKTYFLNHLFYKHLIFNKKCPEHVFLKIIISIPFTSSLEIWTHTMVHYLPLRNNITTKSSV